MGSTPSTLNRDSLYPESARNPENRGKFAGRDIASDGFGTTRREALVPPTDAPSSSEPTDPPLASTSKRRIDASEASAQRRRDSATATEGVTQEQMNQLRRELDSSVPTWEYRIDSYGKVVRRSRQPTMQKLKEEPLVPIGVLATCTILFMASREFQRGDARQMNRYLWWRVYAQGGTLALMVAGSIYYEQTRADRTEKEARLRGWPVEDMRQQAGWKADGSERLSGRRPPSFWDPLRRLSSALSRS